MATKTQLLQLFAVNSYTHGWSAITAYDLNVIGPLFESYYAPMVHGATMVKPISVNPLPIGGGSSSYLSIDGLVLGNPRISFANASLNNSVIQLSFAILEGAYTQYKVSAGMPDGVEDFIQVGLGASYHLTMDLDLARCEGSIDEHGVSRLKIGAVNNPRCNLGDSDRIRELIGNYLLEQLLARRTTDTLPIGQLFSERGLSRPKQFYLRVHPLAGSSSGEGELLVFIGGPDGAQGNYPTNGSGFPHLVPDDRNAQGRLFSASILSLLDYPRLGAGEDVHFFGDVLFPTSRFFTVESSHTLQNNVHFGSLRLPTFDQRSPVASRRNAPGVTARLTTRVATESASPVVVQGSTQQLDGWSWHLAVPGVGYLATSGAVATYTPPASINTRMVVQRIIGQNSVTRAHVETTVLVSNYVSLAPLSKTLVANTPPGATVMLESDYDTEDPLREVWSVLGGGTFEGGAYTAPAEPESDIDVVICEYWYDRPGNPSNPIRVTYGYCIIHLATPPESKHWTGTPVITLEADFPTAHVFPNGLQQFSVTVKVQPPPVGTDEQPPITDEELATLRLVDEDGTELPLIPLSLEGITPQPNGTVAPWAVKAERNRYELAQLTTPPNQVAQAPEPLGIRTRTFYVHCTAESRKTFAARFTDIYHVDHTSNKPSGTEEGKQLLTIVPANPARFRYAFGTSLTRVRGGYQSTPSSVAWTVTNPNNDWNLDTTDYWPLDISMNGNDVTLQRIEWKTDGPGVKWESRVANEDMFSYLGYAFFPTTGPVPQSLEFGSALYDPAVWNRKENVGANAVDANGKKITYAPPVSPPYSEILGRHRAGSLLIALIRTDYVFWGTTTAIPGFDLENRDTVVWVWDSHGNLHKLAYHFLPGDRHMIAQPSLQGQVDIDIR